MTSSKAGLSPSRCRLRIGFRASGGAVLTTDLGQLESYFGSTLPSRHGRAPIIGYLHALETGSQAKTGVGRLITFYNLQRTHAAHGGQPPAVVYFNSI